MHESIAIVFNKVFRNTWLPLKTFQRFSHIFYNVTSNLTIVVPMHGNKDIKKGTLLAILKQAGIDKNEF